MSNDIMGALMSIQMTPPSAADMAQSLISSFDSDDDGALSETEITTALSANGDADVSQAFASMDVDGDGAISADEMTSAISAHRPPPPPQRVDPATSILTAFDTDDTAGLSLDEVTSALGDDANAENAASAFTALDLDGDGVLSAAELSSAMQAQAAQAYQATASRVTTAI